MQYRSMLHLMTLIALGTATLGVGVLYYLYHRSFEIQLILFQKHPNAAMLLVILFLPIVLMVFEWARHLSFDRYE